VDKFKKRIFDEISQQFVNIIDTPDESDFDRWVNIASRIWERLQEYKHNLKFKEQGNKPQALHKTTTYNQPTPKNPNAIDLDHTIINHLTDTDRQWCIEYGACFFYRKIGHNTLECPAKQAADEKNVFQEQKHGKPSREE